MPVNNLLVEIGSEELPPKSLNTLRSSFTALCAEEFKKAGFDFESIQGYATPRRLAIFVEGLSSEQPEQQIERKGPAHKAAFDDSGEPTKALLGFARSCGVDDLTSLTTIQTDKGEWVVYRATLPGKSLSSTLEGILKSATDRLPIERRMRWGKSRNEFVRPVQWLVALYGDTVIPINLFDLTANRVSMGHRFMSTGPFPIAHANDYVEQCRSHKVVVSFEERQSLIESQVVGLANKLSGTLAHDEALLEEVTSLVEWPVALAGEFSESFLSVPPEVLVSAMKEHQRYFHLTAPTSDKLLAKFITVSNIESQNPSMVISGNERVIRARLSDAAFFFEKDSKIPLETQLERLKSVVFQVALGSYFQKAKRIGSLATYLAGVLGVDEKLAGRAGLLCKADLVSDLVGEFSDLQGIMGAYYAISDNEPDSIAKAIGEHYRPIQSGAQLPEGALSSTVALADKFDTLVGLFGINEPPTGSRDPFALRRQSLGIIRISIENNLRYDLVDCLHKAADLYEKSFDISPALQYILDRLKNYYGEMGIGGDVIDAVLAGDDKSNDLVQIDQAIRAIDNFRRSETAVQIIAANKRVANLLKKIDQHHLKTFDPTLMIDEAEKTLATALGALEFSEASIEDRLKELAGLQKPIDAFFEKVLVMAEDEKLRFNRLCLLRNLRNAFLTTADFSILQ